jgi:hypothetical protein
MTVLVRSEGAEESAVAWGLTGGLRIASGLTP